MDYFILELLLQSGDLVNLMSYLTEVLGSTTAAEQYVVIEDLVLE